MAARKGARGFAGAFVLQLRRRPAEERALTGEACRIGFTVTKKVGNAVMRNRIRRRLRAAVATLPPDAVPAGHDAVLIANETAARQPFEALRDDVARALAQAAKGGVAKRGADGQKRRDRRGGERSGSRRD